MPPTATIPRQAHAPWLPSRSLPSDLWAQVREEAIFSCHKWDPQVGDTDVILMQPLVLPQHEWDFLASTAEGLATELLAAEQALWAAPARERKRVLAELGLPNGVVRVLRKACSKKTNTSDALAPEAFRVMRFDFHHTNEGWLISEVNSDVPGGFVEASDLASLIATHAPPLADGSIPRPAGDPAQAVAEAFAKHLPAGACIGLVHATAYTDDRQVMYCLAERLQKLGMETLLLSPADVRFRHNKVEAGETGDRHCETKIDRGWRPLNAMFRFFPGEWLPNLGWRSEWRRFFTSGCPSANPAWALASQSKRFPLFWDRLGVKTPQWDKYLPSIQDPRTVDSLDAPQWVIKPALGRVGDAVSIAGVTPDATRRKHLRTARRHPKHWVAQRRFTPTPWETCLSSAKHDEAPSPAILYPCIGVYVIDGQAAGAYGRASCQPLIEAHAHDIAVLFAPESNALPPSVFK